MKLRELFEQNIERNINGVVKVEQVNDIDILHQELSEFVVTSELKKHFKTFYMNYNNSLDVRTDKMGVWISGFFGSGKSHFLKMLSYLLENNEVQGKKAVDYFANKDLDDMTYADIKRAASVPTETILFNIDTKSAQETKLKESGIVDVFLKVFNEKLGYSSEFPNFADIERYFDSIGKYEEYKNSVCSKLDLTWDKAVAKLGFKKDVFIQSYIEITGQSEQSAKELFANATERRAFITPENFAKMIKEYLDSKGPKNRLIFLVDEIGQFISDNTNLMLNLQTVVENLGSYCNGRAWVMVTSQEAIDSLTKGRFRDQGFSKIQGRFDTKLSLSGANTDEVIKKRLLAKTNTAKSTLEQYYNEQEKILANLITFSSQTSGMKLYENAQDFIDCYPFVPYQVKLLQNVFSALRNFSHAGAHLASGERSMLNAFHSALKTYGDKEITELVPFNIFYSTIKTFIDTDIVRIIEQAKDGNSDLEDFDVEVLILLFLIKYIKEVPCDIENIATLMITNINQSKNTLKSKIESALTRLKSANLITQNGELYDFLTNEEQDVSRGISNTQIDSSDVLNEVYRNIYEEIFSSKSVTPIKNHTYYFTRRVDDIVRGSQFEDIDVKFITSMNSDYQFSDNDLKLKFFEPSQLFIKLKDNGYLQELDTVLKTEKYIKQKSGVKQTEIQNRIITGKSSEILERKKRVREQLERAILESTFFSAGQVLEVTATSAAAKIENALKIVVSNTYTKLEFIKEHITDEREIYAKLNAQQTKLSVPNEKALKELSDYLQMQSQLNQAVTMQNLKSRYTKKPFGWALLDIAGLVADLVSDNQVQFCYNGAVIPPDDKMAVDYLTNDKKIQSVEIKVKTQIDSAVIQQITMLARDLFETQNLSDDGEKLSIQVKDEMSKTIEDLQDLKAQHNNPAYPDKSVIEIGIETLKRIKSEPDTLTFFNQLTTQAEALKDWKEQYKLVKSFFNSQKRIFDEALEVHIMLQNNQIYINMMQSSQIDELNVKSKHLTEIIETNKPYSQIKELPPLTAEIKNIYNELLSSYKQAIGEIISDHAYYIAEEASKVGLDNTPYTHKFSINVSNLYENTNDFSKLNALSQMSSRYYDEILKQINSDAMTKQIEETPSSETITEVAPIVKELEFVKPASISDKQILETEQDVDNYINKLSAELKAKIRDNKRIRLQG